MGDYESRLFDVKMDFSSLCDRINRRDTTLCDEDWCSITNDFDLGWIEAVYKNIKVDDMFDVVTELICRQYSTMVIKGQIDDPFPHVNEAGMMIDYPEYYLNKYRDEIRSQRAAEELERKTRIELKQKMKAMKKDACNTKRSFPTVKETKIITEDVASQMDWVKVTKNFNPDAIKDLIKNIGKSKREKKIVVKAIYDAMTHSGELSRIPYSVDKLLDDLYRAYDENHRGVFEAYDEKREALNLDIFMRGAIEEYMEKHTATDEDIDEIFNSVSIIQEIDKHPVVLDNVPEEFKKNEAKELMHKLSCAGLVSDDWQPIDLSIAERGYLAGEIASRLKIKNKWIVLGKLWGQKPETLRQGNNKATGQAKTGLFIEKLKRILG